VWRARIAARDAVSYGKRPISSTPAQQAARHSAISKQFGLHQTVFFSRMAAQLSNKQPSMDGLVAPSGYPSTTDEEIA
jgi:hypothetical protein